VCTALLMATTSKLKHRLTDAAVLFPHNPRAMWSWCCTLRNLAISWSCWVLLVVAGPTIDTELHRMLLGQTPGRWVLVFPRSSYLDSFWMLIYCSAYPSARACGLCHSTFIDAPVLGWWLRFVGACPCGPDSRIARCLPYHPKARWSPTPGRPSRSRLDPDVCFVSLCS
jgi:1-acyl-sn-glycerol-3-phosphate acyltransferase